MPPRPWPSIAERNELFSATGVGLWIAVLVSIAFVPPQIFVPIFLQRLHGVDALTAGYALAGASMAWTIAAVAADQARVTPK